MKNAVIIGGGLAGLVAAIQLARHGVSCLVIEKNQYPAHKVCGEYVSNEAIPFLNSVNLLPGHFDRFPKIEKFLLSDFTGRTVELGLDPGGFGISRYCFDQHLYDVARLEGVQFLLNTTAGDVRLHENHFVVHCGQHAVEADVVIGAFGKRSRLDVRLQRPFMR